MNLENIEKILKEINDANRKTNLPASTFFDYTSITLDEGKRFFRLYSGNGYDGAYCEAEDSIEYTIRVKDFWHVIEDFISGKNSSINSNALINKKNYKSDSHYDPEFELSKYVSLGCLKGVILFNNFIIDLSGLEFRSFEGYRAFTSTPQDKEFTRSSNKFLECLLHDRII